MFGVGCSRGSDDGTKVLGAVVDRSGLGAAVPAGIEGIPVPEGRAFSSWARCGKRQDSIGATWRWYRTDDTLTVEVGRDDRTGEGYVLTVVRPDHNPQSYDAG
jgi:hypothetical protein